MIKFLLTSSFLLLSLSALANPLPQQAHVYVEGSGSVEVEPDEMSFTLSISETSNELATAKLTVDEKSNTLISLCKKLGIDSKDIMTSTLRIQPQFRYDKGTRVQTGTQVSRQVDITLRDLSKYADTIKAFVNAEITQTVNTKLLLSDPTQATDKALAKAMKDANQRAKRLAETQNRKLGSVYSISEFNQREQEFYQLRVARNISGQSNDAVSARGGVQAFAAEAKSSEPFEPGVIKANAQVYVVYLLN